MRAILPWLFLPILSMALHADERGGVATTEEAVVSQVVELANSMPWVGLEISSLDEAMRAHAAGVPNGVGFLVKAVAADGPAKAAGMRRFDVLWKFEDQLLVNEAQFAVLLNLRKVGDEVKVGVVRCGKEIELSLILGEAPDRPLVRGISPADLPLIPTGVPGMPQVRVTPHDRTAELTRADGSSAKLFYKDDEAFVTILAADQKVIYDGPVRDEGRFAVPDDWAHSLGAMFRSLYKANNPGWEPRRPRPRVVNPSNGEQSPSFKRK